MKLVLDGDRQPVQWTNQLTARALSVGFFGPSTGLLEAWQDYCIQLRVDRLNAPDVRFKHLSRRRAALQ